MERTKTGPAFTRRFKGKTMLYVFHNNGSSEGNEAHCFTAQQVYVSYILLCFFFHPCDLTVELKVELVPVFLGIG